MGDAGHGAVRAGVRLAGMLAGVCRVAEIFIR